MRIFIIHSHYQDRGGEDVVVEQESQLLSKNSIVKVYYNRNQKGFKGLVQTLLSIWNVFEANRIIRQIKLFQPDVVHIHNLHYSIGPLVIRKISELGIPVCMTLHNYRLICPSAVLALDGKIFLNSIQEDFPWTAVKKKAHSNSVIKTFWLAFTFWFHKKIGTWNLIDRYITLTGFAKDIFIQSRLKIPSKKFVIKGNSVEDLALISSAKPILASITFLYIGRLSREKGILPLVKILNDTNIHLRIGGEGPLKSEIGNIIRDNPNIKLLGNLSKSEVVQEILNCTAVILPSICYEGMPMTILESFSLNRNVIASDIGAMQSIINEGINGYKFNPYDREDVLKVLRKWLTLDEITKQKMGGNARKDYEEKFSNEVNLIQLQKIYKELIVNPDYV
ncbi:MAG: glycosyltransferase family 4 protein [Chitinophagales bacterium]|nr:glycosyltransferase family 4 protein [Chitinophagales bacterium]